MRFNIIAVFLVFFSIIVFNNNLHGEDSLSLYDEYLMCSDWPCKKLIMKKAFDNEDCKILGNLLIKESDMGIKINMIDFFTSELFPKSIPSFHCENVDHVMERFLDDVTIRGASCHYFTFYINNQLEDKLIDIIQDDKNSSNRLYCSCALFAMRSDKLKLHLLDLYDNSEADLEKAIHLKHIIRMKIRNGIEIMEDEVDKGDNIAILRDLSQGTLLDYYHEGLIERAKVIILLEKLLDNKNYAIRRGAVLSIGEIGTYPETYEYLKKYLTWFNWKSRDIKDELKKAMEQIEEREKT